MQGDLKTVSFNKEGQILLDGELLDYVKFYKLEYSADPGESAELTVTMSVKIG